MAETADNLVQDGWEAVEERQWIWTEVTDDARVAAKCFVVVAERMIDGRVERRQVYLLHADHHAEPGPWQTHDTKHAN